MIQGPLEPPDGRVTGTWTAASHNVPLAGCPAEPEHDEHGWHVPDFEPLTGILEKMGGAYLALLCSGLLIASTVMAFKRIMTPGEWTIAISVVLAASGLANRAQRQNCDLRHEQTKTRRDVAKVAGRVRDLRKKNTEQFDEQTQELKRKIDAVSPEPKKKAVKKPKGK